MGMQKKRALTFDRLTALLLTVAAAACSGGGGGAMSPAVPAPANSPPPPPAPDFIDTGTAGSVGAPASASFGSAPAQLATPGGATFDNPNGPYATNATFPLILTGLQKTSTGLSALSGDQGATATVTTTNAQIANNTITTTVQITIPSLGVNQTVTSTMGLESPYDDDPIFSGLSYVILGRWSQRGTYDVPFVFGYETPQTAMPTSGTAVFSGGATAIIYKPVSGEIQSAYAHGGVSISANFGSGSVSGSFTNMLVNSEHWNDVTVTGNIATGTNKFSGTTAAASSPGGPMSLSASATGHIDGAFYGPAAQNLGAVWSLSDGTGSAIGSVLAGH